VSTRFELANNEAAGRDAFPTQTALAFGLWFYLHALPAGAVFAPIMNLYSGFAGITPMVNSAGKLKVYDWNGGAVNGATGIATLSTLTWYYLWGLMSSAFAPLALYLGGSTTADLTTSANMSIDQATMRLEFATDQSGFNTDQYSDISLSSAKLWASALAASNANAEKASKDFVTSTTALANYYFDGTDVTDHHTTVRHLTAVGTLSAGPDSPLDTPAYSAAVTGTGGGGMTESEVVAGGKTLIITLSGTTWIP
jgi:hypothetical protein